MKITDKNLQYLTILGVLLMILIFYFLPYKILDNKKDSLKNEVNELQSVYDVLKVDEDKKEFYKKGITELGKRAEILNKSFPAELSQEYLIYVLTDMEKTLSIKFPGVNIGIVEEAVFDKNKKDKNSNQTDDEAPQAETSAQQSEATVAEQKPENKEIIIKRNMVTSASMSYAQLKDFIRYIYGTEPIVDSAKKRIVMENLSLSLNNDNGLLKADFGLVFYGIHSNERKKEVIDLGEFPIGKNGIFVPFEGFGASSSPAAGNSGTQSETPDFFLMLSPTSADQTSVVAGKASGANSSAFVYSDANSFVNVTFEVFKNNGAYFYKYSAGNDKYPKDNTAVSFIPGKSLDLKVISNFRNGSEDKSGANVKIINNTDMPFNIVRTGDDKNNPRFKLASKTGTITGN